MLSQSIITLSLLAASLNAQTNNTSYAGGLLSALNSLNLTSLAGVAAGNAASLLPLLNDNQPKIVFAPSNAAFSSAPNGSLTDTNFVLNLVKYHIINSSLPTTTSDAHFVAKSSLNDTALVNLPGGEAQRIVLTSASNDSITVLEATRNLTSVASAVYENLHVFVIDSFLTIPANLTTTATEAGLSSLTGALTTYAPSAVPAISNATGVTIFAPVNAAFTAAMALVGTLNASQITNVLQNHVVLSGVVYSTDITNGQNVTTASGESLTLSTNSTGAYVTSGTITVKIITADVLIKNGVVHLIDGILANTNANATAAAAAAAAAGANNSSTSTATKSGTTSSPTSTSSKSSANQIIVGSATGIIALLTALIL